MEAPESTPVAATYLEMVCCPLNMKWIFAKSVKSVQSALSDLKRLPERLQSQCNYWPFIT